MRLSILIPVYNEKSTILKVIKEVEKVKLPNKLKKEIIIVDDYSTDGTREILKKIKNYKILYHDKNKGKGSAIRTGLGCATGDIILIQDADLEYSPTEYPNLLKPILANKTEVVYGSRFIQKHEPRYKLYYFGNLLLTWMTNILFGSKISDMETCYKVFTKKVLKDIKLKARRFDFEPEITAKILRIGYSILEVPITYKSRKISEGKKISWKDGIMAAYYLVRYRFLD